MTYDKHCTIEEVLELTKITIEKNTIRLGSHDWVKLTNNTNNPDKDRWIKIVKEPIAITFNDKWGDTYQGFIDMYEYSKEIWSRKNKKFEFGLSMHVVATLIKRRWPELENQLKPTPTDDYHRHLKIHSYLFRRNVPKKDYKKISLPI